MIDELSIIVPTLNEETYLPNLLKSLSIQQFPLQREVIVVDGHSQDKTVKVAQAFRKRLSCLRVIRSEKGISKQRNKGAEIAQYKYLLFLDADIVLPDRFLERFLSKVNNSGNFIYTSVAWVYEKDLLSKIIVALMYPFALIIAYIDHPVAGFFIFTTRKNHYEIRGFREDLILGEDLDYGQRSYKNGSKYYLNIRPFIYHSARRLINTGRINFFLHNVKLYLFFKIYGVKTVSAITYPFGNHIRARK